jgi:hypothetical protein
MLMSQKEYEKVVKALKRDLLIRAVDVPYVPLPSVSDYFKIMPPTLKISGYDWGKEHSSSRVFPMPEAQIQKLQELLKEGVNFRKQKPKPDAYLALGDAILPKPAPAAPRRRALPSISSGPMKIGLQVGFHDN